MQKKLNNQNFSQKAYNKALAGDVESGAGLNYVSLGQRVDGRYTILQEVWSNNDSDHIPNGGKKNFQMKKLALKTMFLNECSRRQPEHTQPLFVGVIASCIYPNLHGKTLCPADS